MNRLKIGILAAFAAVVFAAAAGAAQAQSTPTASIAYLHYSVSVGAATGGLVSVSNPAAGADYTITITTTDEVAFDAACTNRSKNGVSPGNRVVLFTCSAGDATVSLELRAQPGGPHQEEVVSTTAERVTVSPAPAPPSAPVAPWGDGTQPQEHYLYYLETTLTNSRSTPWEGIYVVTVLARDFRSGGYMDLDVEHVVTIDEEGKRVGGSMMRRINPQINPRNGPMDGWQFYAKVPANSDLTRRLYMGGSRGAPSWTFLTSGGRGGFGQASNIGLVQYTQNLEVIFDIRLDNAVGGYQYIWRGTGFDIQAVSSTDDQATLRFRVGTSGSEGGYLYMQLIRGRFYRIAVLQTDDRYHLYLDGVEITNPDAPSTGARTAQIKNLSPWRTDESNGFLIMNGSTISGSVGPIRVRDTKTDTVLADYRFSGTSIRTRPRQSDTTITDVSVGNYANGGPALTTWYKAQPDAPSAALAPLAVTRSGDIAVGQSQQSAPVNDAPGSQGVTDSSTGLTGILAPLRETATRRAGGSAWIILASLLSVAVSGRIMRASNSMLGAAAAGILVYAIGAAALGIPLVFTIIIGISLVSCSLLYAHAR